MSEKRCNEKSLEEKLRSPINFQPIKILLKFKVDENCLKSRRFAREDECGRTIYAIEIKIIMSKNLLLEKMSDFFIIS